MCAASVRWRCATIRGATPTIKNHSATLVGHRLFVFGGYDGRRNHNALHVLDCETLEWETGVKVRAFFFLILYSLREASLRPFPPRHGPSPISHAQRPGEGEARVRVCACVAYTSTCVRVCV